MTASTTETVRMGRRAEGTIKNTRVALVCMPFFIAARPSIQLGLLHALAETVGVAVDSYHLNLDLAVRLSPAVYDTLSSHRRRMTGDWLFSYAAFGDEASSDAAYFEAFPEELEWLKETLGEGPEFLTRLRRDVLPDFIDDCLGAVDWNRYRLVGFSSTFQQNVASLALARRIKQRYPETLIVFGGANFEDEMGPEYVRAFPFLDLAVVGEGDSAFPALLESLTNGHAIDAIPGLVRRERGHVVVNEADPPTQDLNALPTPDYHEYFERAERLGLLREHNYVWAVPFESSRGCWWGQKHHCTFCGLNGLGMAYRAKTPDRLLEELATLARRHRLTFFEATDNILDMKYVDGLFARLRDARLDYEFFYEVKANLTREQIRTLQRGGMRWVQPGIESLSSHVLQLMRKGTTMLQNVRLLKWCRYYRIRVSWNLLWGFPAELEEDYIRELEVLRLITHLEPPGGCGRIWLERFSPYFLDRDRFPVSRVRPERSYSFVYPAHVDLARTAYFFEYEMGSTLPDEAHRATGEWIKEWRRRWSSDQPDTLTYRRTGDTLFIEDGRGSERRGVHTLPDPLATLYELCSETMRTPAEAAAQLEQKGFRCAIADVRAAVDEFCHRGLVVAEGDRYLSLALPTNPNW